MDKPLSAIANETFPRLKKAGLWSIIAASAWIGISWGISGEVSPVIQEFLPVIAILAFGSGLFYSRRKPSGSSTASPSLSIGGN
tara:strand:- start:914 stop:1165 length:252 start_codon:yes stop_codon:yes gene_type:complete